jgi:magnesium transporter
MLIYYHRTLRDERVQVVDAPKRGSWVRVIDPDHKELSEVSKTYNLDIDLLEDGIDLYEAPRLERSGENIYIYVRYSRPAGESTSTHPLLVIISANNIITVSRTEAEPLDNMARSSNIVTTQKVKLVLNILEEVNRGYRSHLNAVTKRILSTRSKLRRTIISNKDILNFIEIEEDLNEFLAALQPYGLVLQALLSGKYIKAHEEDEDLIEDLQLSSSELIELTKSRLKTVQNTRDAYTAIATNNLNQIFKRLTSIAIFMAVPTIVSGFFGMNVLLPIAHEDPNGFWVVAGLTALIMVGFIVYFRQKRWL